MLCHFIAEFLNLFCFSLIADEMKHWEVCLKQTHQLITKADGIEFTHDANSDNLHW